jgi:hypothetical protein
VAPCAGAKPGNELVAYIFIFLQDGSRDWLFRRDGIDVFGETYSRFRGAVLDGIRDVTAEFMQDPEGCLSRCASLSVSRRDASEVAYSLNGSTEGHKIVVSRIAHQGNPKVVVY